MRRRPLRRRAWSRATISSCEVSVPSHAATPDDADAVRRGLPSQPADDLIAMGGIEPATRPYELVATHPRQQVYRAAAALPRAAASRGSASPAACPCSSFHSLKLSRSITVTEIAVWSPRHRKSRADQHIRPTPIGQAARGLVAAAVVSVSRRRTRSSAVATSDREHLHRPRRAARGAGHRLGPLVTTTAIAGHRRDRQKRQARFRTRPRGRDRAANPTRVTGEHLLPSRNSSGRQE